MSAVVLAVAAVAAVACPVHMLWQMRHGRRSTCAPATPRDDVAALRRRQHNLEARIAELSAKNGDEHHSYAPTARG
jgi:hypothetical protein